MSVERVLVFFNPVYPKQDILSFLFFSLCKMFHCPITNAGTLKEILKSSHTLRTYCIRIQ